MSHTIFFDREENGIDGVLTLQKWDGNNATKIFECLPARSGLNGYTKTDWVTGKSPIPWKRQKGYWMNTAPVPLWMEPRGTPFFLISTKKGTGIIIDTKGRTRTSVGLHMENDYPGSAGCIVLLHNTPERKKAVLSLFEYLKKLRNHEPFIRLIVL